MIQALLTKKHHKSFHVTGALYILAFTLIMSSCARIKMERVNYAEDKGIYEYELADRGMVSLRTDSGYVVTENNYHDFHKKLLERKYRYAFNKRTENAEYLKNSDYALASAYFSANRNIRKSKYNEAISDIERTLKIYPDAAKYSDVLFLKGYSYEKLDQREESASNYLKFLRLSSGKYSQRFRSYRDADPGDSIFSIQRIYAKQYFESGNTNLSRDIFREYTPAYYYTAFHPGYNINPEALYPGSKTFIWVGAGYNIVDEFIFGMQAYYNFSQTLDLNAGFFADRTNWGINYAVPVQLYRSETNHFGLKVSPFFTLSKHEKVNIEGIDIDTERSFLDFGAKLSLGYYLSQKLSVGGYYTYHFHNEQNPYFLANNRIKLWYKNEYDISMYYHIYKTISLKGGVRNGQPTIGMLLSGWELSYDWGREDMVNRAELF